MARIFTYIAHRAGVADDSASELVAAAKRIDASASPIALVTGSVGHVDAVCESLRALRLRDVASNRFAQSRKAAKIAKDGYDDGLPDF